MSCDHNFVGESLCEHCGMSESARISELHADIADLRGALANIASYTREKPTSFVHQVAAGALERYATVQRPSDGKESG